MTDISGTKSLSRTPRWLKLAFALSLGANLAVIGVVAGSALREPPHGGKRYHKAPPPPAAADAIGGVMFRSFDPDQQRMLRDLGEGEFDSVVDRRIAELKALLDLIRQEPLDVARLRDRIAEQSSEIESFKSTLQDAWIGKLQQMSPEERAAFADRVERHIARFRKPKSRDGQGGGTHGGGTQRGSD
ncbi:periplasmic heavy metal sensor [Phaeobacter sp. B1627]|uniref:periplasmic heavy metal sensor n=1 Tax=Phaeobacter sp. B1627 TaxID=2583809 RepID=UPI0011199F0E|nr:periplasmic heavy metal sensor [Phaeobacter sp. B1627]TNJ41827.1 periplasmic heavy metal sensor [Phaeobacter sp. B1627]